MVGASVGLTFYGGAGEVGGNAILLQDYGYDVAILFDFGISYGRWSQYFSFPFSMPKSKEDLMRCDVIPRLKGIYTGDDDSVLSDCIISHAHADHYRFASLLKDGTKLHMSECCHRIIGAVEEARRSTRFDDEIVGRERRGELKIEDFRTGSRIRVGGLEIEPVHVDHSIPGAYAFLIHTSCGRIAYSGDFRGHGTESRLTDDFVDLIGPAGDRLEAFLCEGTNAAVSSLNTEEEVGIQMRRVADATDGLVMIDSSYADLDRTRTISQVASDSGRQLVISPRIANILDALRADSKLHSTCLGVLENSRLFLGARPDQRKKTKLESKAIKVLEGSEASIEDIRREPRRYVLAINVYSFEELEELDPPAGSTYVLSSSEPFNEEREYDYERLLRWLGIYGIPKIQVHASGHANPMYTRGIVKKTHPRRFIPIHTEHPKMMRTYLHDVSDEVLVPKMGSKLIIQ